MLQLDPPAKKKLPVQRLRRNPAIRLSGGGTSRTRTDAVRCGASQREILKFAKLAALFASLEYSAGAPGAVVRSKELLGYALWVVRFPVERADRRTHSSNSGVDRHPSEILPRILPTSRYRRRQPVLIVRSNKVLAVRLVSVEGESAYERSDFVDDNGTLDFSTHESKPVHTWPCPGILCIRRISPHHC
ncbi:hypothetical protein G5I_06349 [Acromyrmex echinatior]|uniref:Uncharacterized protein n=1 Tax=Acromyrmex echinatior TaxID=103372 RepID=F4WKS9_ACREC|nr:hypothetical protein G5I_06349 [Acromyrmex echinatior]